MKRKKGEISPIVERFFEKRKRMRSVYGWLNMGEMQYVIFVDPMSIEQNLNYGSGGILEFEGGYTVKSLGNNVYLAYNEHYSNQRKANGKKPKWIINNMEIYSPRYMIFEENEFNEVIDLSPEKFEKIKIEKK